MDDLARNLGKSKKTLYKHFRNKADLISDVVEYFVSEQKDISKNIQQKHNNAIDEMAAIYEHAVQAFSGIKPTLIYDLQRFYPEGWERFEDYKNNFLITVVEQNLRTGIEQNLYRKDLEIEIISRYYTSRVEDFNDPIVFPQSKFSYVEVMHAVFTYHIRGIATLQGIQYLENELTINF